MRFQVPQFVEIEDKIIGPFTLKQFLIYFSAVLILIPIYLFSDLSLFITIAIPIVGVAALFAHYRPNGKPLSIFISNIITFMLSSQLYTWHRTPSAKPMRLQDPALEDELAYGLWGEDDNASSLSRMTQSIETHGNVSTTDLADPLTGEETKEGK